MNDKTIITISRQYGSGGKELSDILAKKIGTRCYDRQIFILLHKNCMVKQLFKSWKRR